MPKKPFLGQKCQFSAANKYFEPGLMVLPAKGQFSFTRVAVPTVTLVHANIRRLGSFCNTEVSGKWENASAVTSDTLRSRVSSLD